MSKYLVHHGNFILDVREIVTATKEGDAVRLTLKGNPAQLTLTPDAKNNLFELIVEKMLSVEDSEQPKPVTDQPHGA